MKEYNQYELRFLQVLVSKKRMIEILGEQVFIHIKKAIWRGTEEGLEGGKALGLIELKDDYHNAWDAAQDYLKKDIAKGCGLTVKELFGGKDEL